MKANPTHTRSSIANDTRKNTSTAVLGAYDVKDPHSMLQFKGQKSYHHSVLCLHQCDSHRKEGSVLPTINKTPKRDIKILMGDTNAKIGADNTNSEHIMGRHGIGMQNENGELFVEFCTFNDLFNGGTLFPLKTIHKITWTYPDGRTENQINHITISLKWKRKLHNVRVKRVRRSIRSPPGCGSTQNQVEGLQRPSGKTIAQVQRAQLESEIRGRKF